MTRLGVFAVVALAIVLLTLGARPGGAGGNPPAQCDGCLLEIGLDGRGDRALLGSSFRVIDLSADRRRILYGRRDGLFTARLDGSDQRRVVTDTDIGDARLSPDGTMVAYYHAPPYDPANTLPCGGEELRIATADRDSVRPFEQCAIGPVWSPDSRRLVFTPLSGVAGVHSVANLDGSGRHDLGLWETLSGYRTPSPTWSSRGDLVAWASFARPGPLSGHGSYTGSPATLQGSAHEIDLVRPDGTPVDVIPRAQAPSFSPDGSRLAFVHEDAVLPLGDPESSLWIAGADGRAARLLRKSFNWPVFWSPDGRLLAFTVEGDIYVLRADGTHLRRVTNRPSGGHISAFWWSRDGSRFLYMWECDQEFQPCG